MRAKAAVLYWEQLAGFGAVGLMTVGFPFLLAGVAVALIGYPMGTGSRDCGPDWASPACR